MASLKVAPPLEFPAAGAAEPWVRLNQDLSRFFDELEAHSAAPLGWFTPERAAQLAVLLQRGQGLLANKHWPHPEVPRQKALYAAHLRLLLSSLQALESQLTSEARRLEARHRHVEAARYWAQSQAMGGR